MNLRCLLCVAFALSAISALAEVRVRKVLPHFLDRVGRHTVYPSLYERDAYQAHLRQNPAERGGLRIDVYWKASRVEWSEATLHVELRGIQTNAIREITITESVQRRSSRSKWTSIAVPKEQWRSLGEIAAWRVTVRRGDTELGELKSFLW